MKRIMGLLALLLALGFGLAQSDNISFDTKIEIQEAAAFTDGFIIECPPEFVVPNLHSVCVSTRETGWSEAQLRNWSDYGLGHWRVYKNWEYDNGGWVLALLHIGRQEAMFIAILDSGNLIWYAAQYVGE